MSPSPQAEHHKFEADLELFAPSRSRGGAGKALKEHLAHVEAELEDLRADVYELEEAILQEPQRPLEEILYPRNELGSSRAEAHQNARKITGAQARTRLNPSYQESRVRIWKDWLASLPWGQILGLIVLIVAVLWLIKAIW